MDYYEELRDKRRGSRRGLRLVSEVWCLFTKCICLLTISLIGSSPNLDNHSRKPNERDRPILFNLIMSQQSLLFFCSSPLLAMYTHIAPSTAFPCGLSLTCIAALYENGFATKPLALLLTRQVCNNRRVRSQAIWGTASPRRRLARES